MSALPAPAFDLSDDQRATLEAASEYARRELYPLSSRMDDEEWWPAEAFARLGPAGYLGVTVAEEYGGAGLDLFSSGLVGDGNVDRGCRLPLFRGRLREAVRTRHGMRS